MKYVFVLMLSLLLYSCSTTIYLVRHAEKADTSTDANLSAAGAQRAIALKDSMQSVSLDAIYATQFKRTYQTALPTATAKGLTVTRYTAGGSDSLITALSSKRGKKFLVVGHSNTVPAMLRKIGLNPSMQDIPESSYNFFFKVRISWVFGKTTTLTESWYGN